MTNNTNLFIFILISALFLLGMTVLWTNDWFMPADASYASQTGVRSSLSKKIDEQRSQHIEKAYAPLGLARDQFKEERLKYTNEKYHFRFQFPPSWDGYQILSEEQKREDSLIFDRYCFGFAQMMDIFCVYAYTKSEWDKMDNQKKGSMAVLLEGKLEVFTYVLRNNENNRFLSDRIQEVPAIIQTFELVGY